jgi:hypothetical protein
LPLLKFTLIEGIENIEEIEKLISQFLKKFRKYIQHHLAFCYAYLKEIFISQFLKKIRN